MLEDRANTTSPVISLHMAVFPSYSPNPEPDPVINLMGGGGGDALGSANFFLGAAGNRIRSERDFILYNQRGAMDSDPYPVLVGHFDPITSPAWCRETASYLENSFYYEFPNLAHGVLRHDNCAPEMGLEFINHPWIEPDSGYMDVLGLPEFK